MVNSVEHNVIIRFAAFNQINGPSALQDQMRTGKKYRMYPS